MPPVPVHRARLGSYAATMTDGGGDKSSECAENGDHRKRHGRKFKERRETCDEEDPRRNHRRRMDERGDGRRPLHRVGEPRMQAELRRFSDRAREEQKADDGQGVNLKAEETHHRVLVLAGIGQNVVEADAAEQGENGHDAKGEAEVPDPVDDERLLRGGVGRMFLVPEADQKIGGQADAFPAEEKLQQVVGGHQHQHGEGEEAQICHEAPAIGIVTHVADGIDMDAGGDDVDHAHHHDGKLVDAQRPFGLEASGLYPAGEDADVAVVA